MARPIVALRLDFKGESIRVTTLAQTPRGTRYPTRTVVKLYMPGSEDARAKAIEDAVAEALPAAAQTG